MGVDGVHSYLCLYTDFFIGHTQANGLCLFCLARKTCDHIRKTQADHRNLPANEVLTITLLKGCLDVEKNHYLCNVFQNRKKVMNLRDIKKDIEYVIGAFIDDCSLFSSVNSKADDEALGELLDEAVDLFNDLKDKVNFKGEGAKGAYYASIRKELLEKTDALYAKLSEVVKKAGQTE